ncbi:MAG: hypothetical protein AAGM33_10190 [Pseudomonadota bacterium]
MTGNYTEELDVVKKDLKTLKTDLSKLTDTVSADVKSNAAEMRNRAASKVGEARENAVRAGTKGRHQAEKTIKDNPFLGIAATASVGLIIGALLARR